MADPFSGEATFAGLSNWRDVTKACPPEFRDNWHHNKWCDYVSSLFYSGGSTKEWKWKAVDPDIRKKQKSCLMALLSDWGPKHEDKIAAAGWMLSEMLQEVPNGKK